MKLRCPVQSERGNRASQAHFKCLSCGHSENADVNAAKNILAQGLRFVAQRVSTETACHEKPSALAVG
ncbi:zinc ribbon domain-containing protein [Deinococcus radiopugnans]|uniref:zinc ribbon domain-containing protein n=1 Tax=Deinococcus radiopugnans TaxID=57497 RepID=UPI00201371BB|nr:zinc ribbon domain-containing protein [Deinococcus radiopugnans]